MLLVIPRLFLSVTVGLIALLPVVYILPISRFPVRLAIRQGRSVLHIRVANRRLRRISSLSRVESRVRHLLRCITWVLPAFLLILTCSCIKTLVRLLRSARAAFSATVGLVVEKLLLSAIAILFVRLPSIETLLRSTVRQKLTPLFRSRWDIVLWVQL